MTKFKLFNLLLILFSLIGFLQWGNNHQFLYEVEWDLLQKLFTDPLSVLHPFTLLPLFGQVLLLITLFQKTPSRTLSYLGIGCISLLFLMLLFIGILGVNLKIVFCTLPFLGTAVFVILRFRKYKRVNG